VAELSEKSLGLNLGQVFQVSRGRVSIVITGIRQDEPVDTSGESFTSDGKGMGTDTAQVRAERLGSGNGRVYYLFFTTRDDNGNVCSGEVLGEGVPHDQGQESVPVDDGALYESTKSYEDEEEGEKEEDNDDDDDNEDEEEG
jgi:hypothetical protein